MAPFKKIQCQSNSILRNKKFLIRSAYEIDYQRNKKIFLFKFRAMSQDQEFCRCFICKGENPELGGKLVSMNTVRRHRKKELNWSISTNEQNINFLEDLGNNNLLEER